MRVGRRSRHTDTGLTRTSRARDTLGITSQGRQCRGGTSLLRRHFRRIRTDSGPNVRTSPGMHGSRAICRCQPRSGSADPHILCLAFEVPVTRVSKPARRVVRTAIHDMTRPMPQSAWASFSAGRVSGRLCSRVACRRGLQRKERLTYATASKSYLIPASSSLRLR